ncbi:MAG TPA: hypothetical protein VHB18_05230 [Mycobacteriales bacterium]|nr:hypothetical protein [Mycobacteriales bacterium]
MRCQRSRDDLIGRFDHIDGWWMLASTDRATSSWSNNAAGYGVVGDFGVYYRYPGCKGCGADSWVRCGRCERLSCWDTAAPAHTCPWCGNRGIVSGLVRSLTAVD